VRQHSDTIQWTCLLCLKKGSRALSERDKQLFTHHVFSNFPSVAEVLPKRLCDGCRLRLSSLSTDKKKQMPPKRDYNAMSHDLAKVCPDTEAALCPCKLCGYAFQRQKHAMNKTLEAPYSLFLPETPEHGAQAPTPSSSKPASRPLCRNCLSELGKGLEHICTREKRLENADKALTPRSKAHIAARVVREKAESSGSRTVHLENTHGIATEVSTTPVGAKAKRRLQFQQSLPMTASAMQALQVSENLSIRAVHRVAQTLKSQGVPLEPHVGRAVAEKARQLSDLFNVKTIDMWSKNQEGKAEKVKKSVVVASNPSGLIKLITQARQVGSSRQHIGLDGGGGFLKLCLNVIEEQRTPSQSPIAKNLQFSSGVRGSKTLESKSSSSLALFQMLLKTTKMLRC